ncbi:RNA polymerase sigma factor [Cupriavidus necator]
MPVTEAGAQMSAAIPRLRRYARALVGEPSAADDLVQDTLERAWTKLASWRPGTDMRAWLFGIMHNLHIDQRRKPMLATTTMEDEAMVVSTDATQTGPLELRDLAAALQRLPAEQRELLVLIALEDMSYEELARTLDIPLGTVMSRLSRARARLRAIMEGRDRPNILKVVK